MKSILKWIPIVGILFFVVGCSGKEVPKGFSEESYDEFVSIYEDFQKAKDKEKEYPTDKLEFIDEYAKKEKDGELTKKEAMTFGNLGMLVLIYNVPFTDEGYEENLRKVNGIEGVYASQTVEDYEKEVTNLLGIENESSNSDKGEKKEEPVEEEVAEDNGETIAKKELYAVASNFLENLLGAPDRIIPADYTNSVVQKREDGLYYISSSYTVTGTGAQPNTYYEYEMLVDEQGNFKDAYMPNTIGRYNRPIVYDKLKAAGMMTEELEAKSYTIPMVQ
ncbi:hypothetical protein BEH_24230 [Priestia filamentosa]|uniref:Lipoprotein n=1 Tax=Priestia filamentosa TaxID=1402861 RepID=A0A2S1LZB8_9BACI|nr:hypothetical protein [Priestia filamentosa]AWG44162.1 hypothetical protein BEH_24230 [Priestia filamentosa]